MADSDKQDLVAKHLARTGRSSNDNMTFADYVALERGDEDELAKRAAEQAGGGQRQLTAGSTAAPGTAVTTTRKTGRKR